MGRVRTSKARIAEYWASAEGRARLPENKARIDWGEPMCFACGRAATSADEPSELWEVWNRAMLDRCHLVPASIGGADEPANLVLLCVSCHHDAPDVGDPQYMLRWIARREYWSRRISALAMSTFEDAGLSDDVLAERPDWEVLLAHVDALAPSWTALHGRHQSDATMVALFVEAYRRMLAAGQISLREPARPPAPPRGSR